jgi:hypothetical protein
MADEKKPTQRMGMMVSPGRKAPLGFFPDSLDRNNNGWTGQERGPSISRFRRRVNFRD